MPAKLTPQEKDQQRRLAWFKDARYGMFIHWGLYSQLGRHEWVMNRERIPLAEYEKLADTWKPGPWPARKWAKLAKAAGQRYMVMTTKHHEGFCLFNSELTDYNAAKRGPKRDLVAEYVEACHAEGLKVGFYYSLMDWHHPDGAQCKVNEKARRRFIDFIHGQLAELCTNYGQIDIMWYDVSWPLDAAGWESEKMNALVYSLQPDIIINNRNQIPGDFGTPEEHIVAESRAWEACMTFNGSWGYGPIEPEYRTPRQVLGMLRQVAAGGGNLLLNCGPSPEGIIPNPQPKILKQVGEWLGKYGEAIYDATDPMQQEWSFLGAFTRQGDKLYYHVNRWPGQDFSIGGLHCQIESAKILGGKKLKVKQDKDRVLLQGIPAEAPDSLCSVIELKFTGEPKQTLGAGCCLLPKDPWGKKMA